MQWDYSFNAAAQKQLLKLGHSAQQEIVRYLKARIQGTENPRRFGKPLTGELRGLWRYRVGDYRILCQI